MQLWARNSVRPAYYAYFTHYAILQCPLAMLNTMLQNNTNYIQE